MKFLLPFLLTTVSLAQQPKPAPTKLAPEVTAALEAHPGLVYAVTANGRCSSIFGGRRRRRSRCPPSCASTAADGSRASAPQWRTLAQALAAKGYVTVTISYRLSGEAKFPAAIQDCKAAVRFLRTNAAKYSIQSDAIGVTGLSAGGHLAALLATSGGVKELEGDGGNADQSSAVQACVAMGAQSDLESARIGELSGKADDPFYRTFLGDSQAKIPQTYALASPRHHLDKSDPPLLFMAGELDDPSTHANETRADLEKLGIPTGFTSIPNAPHAFLGKQASFDTCVAACDAFFAKHLKKQ
jgi:arylsulfatase A